MKAVWYTRFGAADEVLELGELPDPEPGPGEVRVRLHASGVNPSDVKQRAGRVRPMPGPRAVPHSDGAGVVDRVGEGVPASHIGRRVWTFNAAYRRAFGTAAEYVVLPLELTAPLPDELGWREGACLGVPAMTAHRCVFARGPVAGQTVLVSGGGGVVGHMAVQLARWGGARVVATAGSETSLAHARSAGADAVFDYRDESAYAAIAEFTRGQGVDLVVEVDLAANAQRTLQAIRPGGVIACYASVSEREPRIPFPAWAARSVWLACVLVYEMSAAQREAAVRDIAAWGAAPGCRVPVAAALPLGEVARAHALVEGGRKTGQVVLDIA